MAAYQYVYVMKDLTKSYPGGREVFKGITLSFLPGVKIGVLGINGAGKSTLMKIIAGIETEYGGEAWAAEGARVGYLSQEPYLDPSKTVAENVAEAFGPLQAALTRFNEISDRFALPMEDDEMEALLAEQATLQEKIDAEDGWDLDRRIEIALDALRCPPPDADVTRINLDSSGKRATGVTYIDADGKEFEQPAELVVLCAFAQHNVHLLLLSGIGKPYDPKANTGVVGRNYAYQITSSVDVFQDDIVNPFMGAGALGQAIDEFNGDNFDHGPEGFIGGGYIALWNTGGRPIAQQTQVPDGTPKWGSAWKRARAENYLSAMSINTHGSVMSYRDSYLDLDPTYRDIYGNPLLRMTFDFHDNELRMSRFLTDKAALIAHAMKPRSMQKNYREGHYSIVPYQTTHNTGGAAMGDDPTTSVVNRYLQSWDVPNVFVLGSSVFPQNHGYNPTGTVGALAFWAADAIRSKYLKAQGPLVQA